MADPVSCRGGPAKFGDGQAKCRGGSAGALVWLALKVAKPTVKVSQAQQGIGLAQSGIVLAFLVVTAVSCIDVSNCSMVAKPLEVTLSESHFVGSKCKF